MEIRSNELSEYNYMFSGFILFSSWLIEFTIDVNYIIDIIKRNM